MTEPSLDPRLSRGARQKARQRLHREAPALSELCPATTTRELSGALRVCNPGLAAHRGEIWCNLRQLRQEADGLRTENLLGRLGEPPRLLPEPMEAPPLFDSRHRGLEDMRLFSLRDRLWGSCTVHDRSWEDKPIMAVLSFDERQRPDRLEVQFHFRGQQKNWVPLVHGGHLAFVYSTDPTIVLRYATDIGQCTEWRRSRPGVRLENQKGGSPALPFGEGWLYLTHESEGQSYLHRFVHLDRQLRVSAVSPAFYFLDRGVEFASGLCRQGEDLLIGFGWRDRRAYLARVPVSQLEGLL